MSSVLSFLSFMLIAQVTKKYGFIIPALLKLCEDVELLIHSKMMHLYNHVFRNLKGN